MIFLNLFHFTLFRQNCGINKIIRYLKCVVLWFMYVLWRDYPHWANFSVTVMRHLYIHCKALMTVLHDYLIFIYIYSHLLFLNYSFFLTGLFSFCLSTSISFFFLFVFMMTLLGTNCISTDLSENFYFILVLEEFSLEIRFPPGSLGKPFCCFLFCSSKNLLSILLLFEGFVFLLSWLFS